MTNRVLLLPWIQLDEPLFIGAVTILPFPEALRKAASRAEQLAVLASIYVDGYTLRLAIQRNEAIPFLKPAVIFVDEDDHDARAAQDAVDVLMVSTIFENDLFRANGATFASAQRYLDGEFGFMADITPTMYGTRMNGIGADAYLEMKPPRTGLFHFGRREELVRALVAALGTNVARDLRRLFDTLRTATSESPDVPMDLAESLVAKAAMLVTHVPGIEDQRARALRRVRELLYPLVGSPMTDEFGYHIARVWQVVRDHRNDFWHPVRHAARDFPFMQQRLVSPMTLAIRMIQALLSARLIELGCAQTDSELADDVVGAERWIATVGPELETGLADLTGIKRQMEHNARAQKADADFCRFRSKARLERGIRRHLAEYPEEPPSSDHAI